LTFGKKRYFGLIHERIFTAIPKTGISDCQIHSGCSPVIGIHRNLYILLLDKFIVFPDLDVHFYGLRRRTSVRDEHFRLYIGLLFRHFILNQIDTGRCIVGQRDINRVRYDQIHIPVDPSIEIKITDQRHNILLQSVVDLH